MKLNKTLPIAICTLLSVNITAKKIEIDDPVTYTPYAISKNAVVDPMLGGIALLQEEVEFINNFLEPGKTILELGSGYGTSKLAQNYKVYAIEHDKKWLHTYPNINYIHIPLVNNWYDLEILQKQLNVIDYDFIVVDGPIGFYARSGFCANLSYFKPNVPIFITEV